MNTNSPARALPCLVLLAALTGAGCLPAQLRASSRFRQPATPLNGKNLVVMFPHHERLQTTSDSLAYTVATNLRQFGVKVFLYRPNQLSLDDDAALAYARESQAEYVLVYALTSARLYNMALSEMSSEGAIIDTTGKKVLWKGSIDYKNPMPGPGSFSRCGEEVGAKLVSTLITDGFLRR
jgi:hypothetical protein